MPQPPHPHRHRREQGCVQPTTMCPESGPRCTVPTTVPCPPCAATRSPTALSVTRAGTAVQPNTIAHYRLACNRPVRRNLTHRRASQIWVGGPSTTTRPFAKRWRASTPPLYPPRSRLASTPTSRPSLAHRTCAIINSISRHPESPAVDILASRAWLCASRELRQR
jgi:hypothetical protein